MFNFSRKCSWWHNVRQLLHPDQYPLMDVCSSFCLVSFCTLVFRSSFLVDNHDKLDINVSCFPIPQDGQNSTHFLGMRLRLVLVRDSKWRNIWHWRMKTLVESNTNHCVCKWKWPCYESSDATMRISQDSGHAVLCQFITLQLSNNYC